MKRAVPAALKGKPGRFRLNRSPARSRATEPEAGMEPIVAGKSN